MTTILPIASPEARLSRVGGKGANLSVLAQAGFAVPPGFLVSTDAYRQFVESNGIQTRLLPLLSGLQGDDPIALDNVSAQIGEFFIQGSLPADTEQAIRSAYNNLNGASVPPGGGLPVAVRSSATAEDLPGMSFAGQQDTYLNMIGEDAVVDAVKRCWASLWTARAIGYRARNHIPTDEVTLAVVVQQMIPSEVSGVLFTANPLTGRRDEIVIDASYGLGEAIVSGQVEPDNYVVSAKSGQIARRKIGAKAIAILPQAGGGTQQISRDGAQTQALADDQILELAQVAQRIAQHFGSPQDIEWAWAGGHLYLLQSRPITSLYPLLEVTKPSNDLKAYLSLNAAQGVTGPFTPLGGVTFRAAISGIVVRIFHANLPMQDVMPTAGGRLYADMTPLLADPRLRKGLVSATSIVDPAARGIFLQLLDEQRVPTRILLTRWRLLKVIFSLRALLGRAFLTVLMPETMRATMLTRAERLLTQYRDEAQTATTLAERLDALEHLPPILLEKMVLKTVLATLLPGLLASAVIDRWLVSWLGLKPGMALNLLRALPGNVTTEMDLQLWALAQSIRADPASVEALRTQPAEVLTAAYHNGTAPTALQRALTQFLDKYGMRGVAEIDIGRPRWRENPQQIVETFASYLQIDDPALAPDRLFEKRATEAERLAEDYIAQVRRTPRGAIRARLLRFVMRRARVLGGLRETPKLYMIRLFDALRTAMLHSGAELTTSGRLDKPEDIFFVPLNALRVAANDASTNLKQIVIAQRADYERESVRRQIPRVLLNTGEAFYQGISAKSANDLMGDGVSPGVVEGRVHVVLDPHSARLEPGEILVCPATDPAWTPLFLSAGGLVMEMGGLVTHGSVVAREYGIPAVVGVHEATTRLRTGQRIRVDGSEGRVTVLDLD